MAKTNRIPWPKLTTLHVPRLCRLSENNKPVHSSWPTRSDCCSPPTNVILVGVRKFHRSVEVLKKTSIHGTRRYAGTLL
jgi:hypothetical protein